MGARHLIRLFEHVEWADARVGASLASAKEPPREALELYAHLLAAELVWLDRVEGREQSVRVWPEPGDDRGAALAETARARRAALVARLPAEDVARVVRYVNSAGDAFETALDDILLHVALHGAYHRGQIATRLAAAGAQASPTDYIAFVRGAAAATRADDERRA